MDHTRDAVGLPWALGALSRLTVAARNFFARISSGTARLSFGPWEKIKWKNRNGEVLLLKKHEKIQKRKYKKVFVDEQQAPCVHCSVVAVGESVEVVMAGRKQSK
jgi:hypothetical protein